LQVSPQKTTFNQVASVTAPDASTVQFTLKDVFAPFEAQIGSPILWILPKEVVEQDGDVTRRVVGSGPFIFDKFDRGVSFTGKKNQAYYRKGEPHIDNFVGLIIPNVATQMAGLRAHELDFLQVPDQELQFCVMAENRRCSILFHLLVPEGSPSGKRTSLWRIRENSRPLSISSRLS